MKNCETLTFLARRCSTVQLMRHSRVKRMRYRARTTNGKTLVASIALVIGARGWRQLLRGIKMDVVSCSALG